MSATRVLCAAAIAIAGCGGERPVLRVAPAAAPSLAAPEPSHSSSAPTVAPDEIRRQVHDRLGRVKDCYEELLTRAPAAEGQFVVLWHIEPDGAVSNVRVSDSTLGDARFERCVVAVFGTMKYSTGPADATWGFKLTPPARPSP